MSYSPDHTSPSSDPLDVALREVTDTKRLLEALITSSESFDYVRAKRTLQELTLKVKVLGRLQADLAAQSQAVSARILPFPAPYRLQT
jgi:hypothetical protein